MTERSDSQLVLRARQGDPEAFNLLIERYQAMTERIAQRMLDSSDAAQDAAQEAMLQAFLSLNDLRDPERFRSWLYGIVLNVCKGSLRRSKRGIPASQSLDEEQAQGGWNSVGAAQDPQEAAIERELHFLVLSAIQELPPAHRQAARLYYYESLTLHEIALITGATPQAIKVRLHRARSSLRRKLGALYPEIQPAASQEARRKTVMIRVKVVDILRKDEKTIVILQDERGESSLPIWIGPPEGIAIAMGLRAYPTERPMTYDLMLRLLEALGAKLVEARVEALRGTTFYGVAKIRVGDEVKEVDARPSDVIALAVRTGSPIYVSEAVMESASQATAACEAELGPITPGEGVEAILQEFEQMIRAQRRADQPEHGEPDSPEAG